MAKFLYGECTKTFKYIKYYGVTIDKGKKKESICLDKWPKAVDRGSLNLCPNKSGKKYGKPCRCRTMVNISRLKELPTLDASTRINEKEKKTGLKARSRKRDFQLQEYAHFGNYFV